MAGFRCKNHRSNDVAAENAIGLLVTDNFHEAIRIIVRLSARVGQEWESANLQVQCASLSYRRSFHAPCMALSPL